MSTRMMKTAADNVAVAFNNSELKLSSEKQDAINYMLYESDEDPISLVEKIGTKEQISEINNSLGRQARNSYYYMRKLVVGLMIIDYALVDKKVVKEGGKIDG